MAVDDKEFITFAVKLLFKRLKEGKVQLMAEGVPQTIEALKMVRFDNAGNPIFETIAPPVRALAKFAYNQEIEAMEKEAAKRERTSPVHDLLGKPVDVNDNVLRTCADQGGFSALAFELYKETGIVICVCSHSYIDAEHNTGSLNRNQAICAGLLIRIVKFMIAVTQLSSTTDRGEVVMALNRSIMESAINLRFLLLKNEEKFYDQFVSFSLGPERELYDIIQKNIRERDDGVLPIETRMLKSIARTTKLSGVPIDEVNPKHRDWGGGLRNRLEALGWGHLYAAQRTGSHAVHGTWVDLLLHHLTAKHGGFVPNPSWSPVDSRLMLPVCIFALAAAKEYLDCFLGPLPDLRPLHNRIHDLEDRIQQVDRAHEGWLSKRRSRKK